jgi:hypothetical protein
METVHPDRGKATSVKAGWVYIISNGYGTNNRIVADFSIIASAAAKG